jgi:corrinoid protein of di/trimethylamine methyltransferase
MNALYNAVVAGDAQAAQALAEQALAAAVEPLTLVNRSMIPAMGEVGRRFEANEYFVPQLLRSARAMKTAMALLRPLLAAGGVRSLGRVVIGTVVGDVHDIGKHLVAAMLEGGGFEVFDLGTSVSADKFIAAATEHQAQIIGMSALLTTTMYAMKTTLDTMRIAGVREQFKVLIGGAPVTRQFAQEIGADGFSNSAAGAIVAAKLVLGIPAASVPGVHILTETACTH